jgi:DNA-directed RNA polymerase subunit RPC12/RpoP
VAPSFAIGDASIARRIDIANRLGIQLRPGRDRRKVPTELEKCIYYADVIKPWLRNTLLAMYPSVSDFYEARRIATGLEDELNWMPKSMKTQVIGASFAELRNGASFQDVTIGACPRRSSRRMPGKRTRDNMQKWLIAPIKASSRLFSLLKKICKWLTNARLPLIGDARVHFYEGVGYVHVARTVKSGTVSNESYMLCPWCWKQKRVNEWCVRSGGVMNEYACEDCEHMHRGLIKPRPKKGKRMHVVWGKDGRVGGYVERFRR